MPKMRVLSVLQVQIAIEKSNPEKAAIFAFGQTTSTGWSAPELRTIEHELSPDGILDLEFVAEPPPPGTVVLRMLTPIVVHTVWERDVERFVGTKILARSNEILKLVSDPDFTTLAVGEEGPPPNPGRTVKTLRWGEDGPKLIVGENPKPFFGEHPKPMIRIGEKWPIGETSPMTDDPPFLDNQGLAVNPFGQR